MDKMDYAELKRLREITGKSMQDCKQALEQSKGTLRIAAQRLFEKELGEIESCFRGFNLVAATEALMESGGNVRGALSILTYGHDIYRNKNYPEKTVYDKSKWHYGGDYPDGLPRENASVHIGMLLKWCAENNMLSDSLLAENGEDIEKVMSGELTGAGFLINHCDEVFSSDMLNDEGNEFVKAYDEDGTSFAQVFKSYGDDFCRVFNEKAERNGFEYESVYHVEDTLDNYTLLKPLIDQRYHQWKEYQRLTGNDKPQSGNHE